MLTEHLLVGVSSAQAPLSLSEVCVLAGEDDKQETVVLDTNICVVFVAYRVYLCILPQSQLVLLPAQTLHH